MSQLTMNAVQTIQIENVDVVPPLEVKTFSLEGTLKVHLDEHVCCISSPLYLVIATRNKVFVLKEDTLEVIWEISADNPTSISLSDDSCLLLVTENAGVSNLYHIPTTQNVWCHVFEKEQILSLRQSYVVTDYLGFLKIYILTKEQIAFELSNIQISSLYKAIDVGNFNEVFDAAVLKEIDISALCPNDEVTNSFEMFCGPQSLSLITQQFVSLPKNTEYFDAEDFINDILEVDNEWNPNEKSIFQYHDFSDYGQIIKACNTRNGKYIVFLNDKHVLSIMCPFTQFVLKSRHMEEKDGCIKNFVLNETVDPNSSLVIEQKIGLLIQTSSLGKTNYVFEIFKFPSFQLIHRISLSEYAQLIDCKPNQDYWYVLEKETVENPEEKQLGLNVKTICESLPEARLANLVNKRKFADAQKLAHESNLNTEVIHKAKIKCILDNLSGNKYKHDSKADLHLVWSELEDSFKHIKDLKFVQSCFSFSLLERMHIEKLLFCIKKWVVQNCSGNDVKNIMSQVNQIINKLLTHEVLCNEFDSCISLNDFLSKDLLNYMITELKAGNLGTSFSIWERHKDELLHSLNLDSLSEIISSIPNSMPSLILMPFLCEEFLPPLFKTNPDTIDVVAEWLIQRLYLMECYEKDLWPENGSKLITNFLQIIHDLEEKGKTGEISFSTNLSCASIHRKFVDRLSPIYCLSKFSKDLTWLVFLKSQFNCKISLTECQESKMNVIFALLDRVDLKFVQGILEKFARPYSLENQLDFEECLEQYVKYALQACSFTWWYWDEDPWEDRLIAITEAIHCTDRWVNAALLIASRAAVPWSQAVTDMVKKGMACDHQKKTYFENEYKLVGLKEVLLKYDLKIFAINDRVDLIDVLVKYIFKQNKSSALEDAEKVLGSLHEQALSSDVYFSYLQYAINHNKLEVISEVFLTLSQDTAVKCAVRLLKNFKMCLDDRFFIEHKKECIQSIIHAGLFFIEYLKSVNKSIDANLVLPFRSLLKLQEEFSIYMTYSEITSRSHCEQVIDTKISDFLENKSIQKAANTFLKNHRSTASGISQLYRLGSILLFEREEVMGFMITNCLKKQRYDLVLKLCQEVTTSYSSTNTSETLMKVVRHFYLNFKNIKDINFNVMVDTICHLTNVAVTYCEDALKYLDFVQLSSYVSTLKDITGQHSLSITPEFTSDSYHKWKFYPIYQDEGFQLDFDLVTNYISEIFFNNVKKSVYAFEDCDAESNFSKMVIHMKDRGQGLLALRTIFMHYCSHNYNPSSKLPVISLVHQLCNETAQKSLNHRKKDHHFTFNLLAILPETSQLSLLEALLKWCSSDLNRLAIVGKIGMEVGNSIQSSNVFIVYENIHKKASLLARQSSKSALNISVILNSSNQEAIWAVVKDVVLSQNITIPIIYECCNAFQLPTDPVLILHLNSIFTESEKYLMFEDYDKRILSTLQKAENVISYITDEALLYETFQRQLKKISPYSYEVFLFIVEQLINSSSNIRTFDSGTAEKEVALLKFLQVYKRISPLDEVEIRRWQALHPMDMEPPSLSKKRLPLHCFLHDDPHKIINPELTANTLPVWLKIAPVLKITMDDLVIIAVKNTVVSYLEKQSSQHILLNPDMRFVSIINDMIERICRSKPESAACCAAWVTNKMPPGGNKVYFANMTVKFSKLWYEQGSNSQNLVDVHHKFILQSNYCATERILYCHKLTSKKILSLMQSPVQLISYLIETFSLNIEECMKACKAASEIGNIIKLDTTDIFLSFILKWCKISSNSGANIDETFSEDLNVSNDGEDADSENILRIINLLLSLPIANFPNFYSTLKIKFQELPLIQRSRLLLCLVAAFDAEIVSSELEVDVQLFDESIVSLMCSVELEKLNLPYSLAMFANCNKTELIQRILSNSNNSKVVTFCIRLCFEFNIWETSIWEVILRTMTMKPVDYAIQDILQSAQGYLKHLWHSEAFVAAWKCVINNILQIRSTQIPVLLSKLYKAVMRCPCVTSLDILYMTNELKYVMQAFDERSITELDSITDMPSFILFLSEMMNDYSSTEENKANNSWYIKKNS
ncbi:hypothetical protein JTE90_009927 [Oedothorax gibbosus]|uniref:Kinetochore-associated protein 1 n=1 Tax=Oedothorax gibbosus TaxID=931172 RepID=A0AAV6UV32_9ARAC|nr:hypothetical protein JTE90_009927 [Oedothorax gibbosus]